MERFQPDKVGISLQLKKNVNVKGNALKKVHNTCAYENSTENTRSPKKCENMENSLQSVKKN